MRVVGLISGGKDSCYNLMKCVQEGHELVALVNLYPAELQDELDSYMYQSVGHAWIEHYSEAIGLPLFRHPIRGKPIHQDLEYESPIEGTPHDEVEDLFEILRQVRQKIEFEAVSVGAIFSTYQSNRVQNVCDRLELKMLAYLWQREQSQLLDDMIKDGIDAILIKVAAIGLDPKLHLGRTLSEMRPILHKLRDQYEINVCGEGGEYETFTLDCPLFRKRIELIEPEVKIHSDDAFAPVGFLTAGSVRLVDKTSTETVEN
jgi:diphthine-ammonia ligase